MTATLFDSLKAPFSYSSILWSIGSRNEAGTWGKVFPRLDPRDVQERLDAVMGPDKWRVSYAQGPAAGGVFCALELYIDGQWVAKSDIGYQPQSASIAMRNADRALEVSLKATASDAFNRAAAMWGIGRYLYKFTPPYVALINHGRHLASFPVLADEFLPENERGTKPWEAMQLALENGELTSFKHGISPVRKTARKAAQSKAPSGKPALRSVKVPQQAPLIGTVEQWQSLNVEQRREIAVILNRISKGLELDAVGQFLQGERAESLPQWARDALEDLFIQRLDKADAAGAASERKTAASAEVTESPAEAPEINSVEPSEAQHDEHAAGDSVTEEADPANTVEAGGSEADATEATEPASATAVA